MKKLFLILTVIFLPLLMNAQVFSAGVSGIAYTPDKTVLNTDSLSGFVSVDLRYKYEINDGHHLLVYSEFSTHKEERREGDVWKLDTRIGFNLFINAIPFDEMFFKDDSVDELRILFGMGFEYDSYWDTGDFVPSIKLHYKHKKLLFELGVQSHIIEAYHYNLVPEFRAGIYYDVFDYEE